MRTKRVDKKNEHTENVRTILHKYIYWEASWKYLFHILASYATAQAKLSLRWLIGLECIHWSLLSRALSLKCFFLMKFMWTWVTMTLRPRWKVLRCTKHLWNTYISLTFNSFMPLLQDTIVSSLWMYLWQVSLAHDLHISGLSKLISGFFFSWFWMHIFFSPIYRHFHRSGQMVFLPEPGSAWGFFLLKGNFSLTKFLSACSVTGYLPTALFPKTQDAM